MAWKVLIAHAEGEEHLAEQLAEPLRSAGYEVAHQGTVLVGESVVEEASKVLSLGGPVVLCGTVEAVGTGWAHRLVNAARRHSSGVRVFPVQMEKKAYLEAIGFEAQTALYWQDPAKAVDNLLAALSRYYPLDETQAQVQLSENAEERYREILLETCDIVNLATLGEQNPELALRQLELRRLYVPLRVWVEVEAGKESEERELWDALEKRRFANLKSLADNETDDRKRQRVPVGERLAEARRLVVLGDPGAGKTTLTRWIATCYLLRLKHDPDWQDVPDVRTLPDEDWLPIIVRCRDLDPNCLNGNLDDILSHTLRKAELTANEASTILQVLQRRIHDGTALLMLDGLDEIAESPTRALFCQQLERIHSAHPKAPIIATSRIVGYREMGLRLGRGFEHVILSDLNREDKDDFARRWCDLTESPERSASAASELIHDIHSIDRIERMTGNPMLLTTMALVKRKVGKLPSHRADLYWEAVQVLLNWRSEVDKPLDQHEAIPQLEYIAYAMCDRGAQQLRRDEILDLIDRMRIDYPNLHEARNHTPVEFLHLLEARTGLLIEVGRPFHLGISEPIYEFRHLTFQEFLAARALAYGRFPERDSKCSLADQVAPLAGRTENVAVTGIEAKDVDVIENWREALRLCTVLCSDDDVDSVLCAILTPRKGEPEATRRARAILATLCVADEPNVSEKIVEEVFQAFSSRVKKGDGGGRVRTSASAAAMEVASTRWAFQLRASLVEEFCRRDSTNRSDLGSLCGMIGARSAPKDPAKLDAWVSERLERLLNGDEHEAIETALTVMILAFEKSRLYEERQNSLDLALSEALLSHPTLPETLLSLLNGNAPMAHAAAWALGWLNSESIGTTSKYWRPEPNHVETILTAIGKSDYDPEAVRFLTWIVRNENIYDAFELLLKWIDHPNSALRRDVAKVLRIIGNERAVEPLIAKLDDPNVEMRISAAAALGSIGNERAVEPLIVKLDDPHPEAMVSAVTALGNIGNKRALESLIAKLGDPHPFMRTNALQALSKDLENIDRILLTAHLTGVPPFVDPSKEISIEFATKAAEKEGIVIEEVKARYEALAEIFNLKLEWRS